MAKGKEGTVGPRERVNIVYRPAAGDGEEVELPFKLMMVGDYSQKPNDTPVEEREPVSIDKDNFSDVMKKMGLSVEANVADKISGKDDAEMGVKLRVGSMRDFEPDQIVKQVPELKKLIELREAYEGLKAPLADKKKFRELLNSLIDDKAKLEKLLQEIGVDNSDA